MKTLTQTNESAALSQPLPSAGGGYTSAPATLLVATRCCACGRKLLDAISVRAGIGPDCAITYGMTEVRGGASHSRANAVIYAIAAEQGVADWTRINSFLTELISLGFGVVAEKIRSRLEPKPAIFLTPDFLDNGVPALRVVAPFSESAISAWRFIPGREFRKEEVIVVDKKGRESRKEVAFNRVPITQKRAVLALLTTHYKGEIASGGKGVFLIE